MPVMRFIGYPTRVCCGIKSRPGSKLIVVSVEFPRPSYQRVDRVWIQGHPDGSEGPIYGQATSKTQM